MSQDANPEDQPLDSDDAAARPDPADKPNLEEFRPPTEETDPDLAQRPYPTPGEEHLTDSE